MKRSVVFHAEILIYALFILMPLSAAGHPGSKPQWLNKGEEILNRQRSNSTYYFKIIKTYGSDLQQAKNERINVLADYIGKHNQITGESFIETESERTDGNLRERENFRMTFKNEFSTSVFNAVLIDDHWEYVHLDGGRKEIQYYALFAVSENKDDMPSFDRFEITRNYGCLPVLMSIIPGAGQLYKGQKVKGFCMMGGAVLGAGSIILCENRRAYYRTRIVEQPKFARHYSQKSDNWQTGRNISVGIAGALVAWSVIDAAFAPGCTRIKISPSASLGILPTSLSIPSGVGLGISLALSF